MKKQLTKTKAKRHLLKAAIYALIVFPALIFLFYRKSGGLNSVILELTNDLSKYFGLNDSLFFFIVSSFIIIIVIFGFGIRIVSQFGFILLLDFQKAEIIDAKSIISENKEKPILFLRPFKSDSDPFLLFSLNAIAYIKTDEQLIASHMSKKGPCIAIGNPDDKDGVLGFSRIYVPNNKWKTQFHEYLQESSYVILSLGSTNGVLWELNQVLKKISPEKIIIYIPWKNMKQKKRENLWNCFRQLFINDYPDHQNKFPETIEQTYFIIFNKNGSSIKIRPKIKLITKILLFGGPNDITNCLNQLHLGLRRKPNRIVTILWIVVSTMIWAFILFILYATFML